MGINMKKLLLLLLLVPTICFGQTFPSTSGNTLPTGAATSANQVTGNNTLTTINTSLDNIESYSANTETNTSNVSNYTATIQTDISNYIGYLTNLSYFDTSLSTINSSIGNLAGTISDNGGSPPIYAVQIGGTDNTNTFVVLKTNSSGHVMIDGTAYNQPVSVTSFVPGNASSSLGKLEDGVAANGDTGVASLHKVETIPTADAASGDYMVPKLDPTGYTWVNTAKRSAATHSNVSMSNATSTTMIASNTSRLGFRIQNNSSGNICCSESGATLTSIVPSNTNPCEVIYPTGSLESKPNVVPTSAITCYQSSGGAITTVSAVEY